MKTSTKPDYFEEKPDHLYIFCQQHRKFAKLGFGKKFLILTIASLTQNMKAEFN